MALLIQVLVVVNPMYNYTLQFMRYLPVFITVPSAPYLLAVGCLGCSLLLLLAHTVFHKTEHKFILYI